MRAAYVAPFDLDAALAPDSRLFRSARSEELALMGTPLGLQPTAAIRAAWADRPIGAVDRVRVDAVHDGTHLAMRLEWSDAGEDRELADTTAFADAAALLFPAADGASAVTMGAPGAAVNAWYWRADENGRGRHVVAEGIGTTRTLDLERVRARGAHERGRWRVVIARALRVKTREPVAQIEPGGVTRFAVAVWEGSRRERAGIKSFSGDWRRLRLDAAPSARR